MVRTFIGAWAPPLGLPPYLLALAHSWRLPNPRSTLSALPGTMQGKKGGIAFQADKSDYRGVLAGLEGITGKKAVNSDAMTVKN